MIGIVDYGVGNIFSIKRSFEKIGIEAELISDCDLLGKCDKLILPGVGAFGDAFKKLEAAGMKEAVLSEVKKGKYLMGICLGMQLLLTEGEEYGVHKGLDIISGKVKSMKDLIKDPNLKIPHMGWNALELTEKGTNSPLLKNIKQGDYVYFVHSYSCVECDNNVLAYSDYSYPVTAIIEKDNVYGLQFHPEKSGDVGLSILEAFGQL